MKYSEIEYELAYLPATMVPALLRVLVRRAVDAKVFVPGGLESFIRSQLKDGGNVDRLRVVLRAQFQSEVGNADREAYLERFAHRLDAAGVLAVGWEKRGRCPKCGSDHLAPAEVPGLVDCIACGTTDLTQAQLL